MKEVVNILTENHCLKVKSKGYYTYSSGLIGPIYCDLRNLYGNFKDRTKVANFLVKKLKESFPQVDGVIGVATAGIASATMMAQILECPLGVVRTKVKDHGLSNKVEGNLDKKGSYVLIEDLINQGTSSLTAFNNIKDSYNIVGVLSTVDYSFKSTEEKFNDIGLQKESLVNFQKILESSVLSKSEIEILERWHDDPSRWDKDHACQKSLF